MPIYHNHENINTRSHKIIETEMLSYLNDNSLKASIETIWRPQVFKLTHLLTNGTKRANYIIMLYYR